MKKALCVVLVALVVGLTGMPGMAKFKDPMTALMDLEAINQQAGRPIEREINGVIWNQMPDGDKNLYLNALFTGTGWVFSAVIDEVDWDKSWLLQWLFPYEIGVYRVKLDIFYLNPANVKTVVPAALVIVDKDLRQY